MPRVSVGSVLHLRSMAHQQLAPTSDGKFFVDIALPGARIQLHAVRHGSPT